MQNSRGKHKPIASVPKGNSMWHRSDFTSSCGQKSVAKTLLTGLGECSLIDYPSIMRISRRTCRMRDIFVGL